MVTIDTGSSPSRLRYNVRCSSRAIFGSSLRSHFVGLARGLAVALDLNKVHMPLRDMRFITCVAAFLGICMRTVFGAAPLHAQTPAYFKALTVPPRTVGTCLEPDQRTDRGAGHQLARRLVMSSRTPNARREMFLVRDATGAVVGLTDMIHVSTGLLASAGETVVASLRPEGRIVGYVMRTETQISNSGVRGFDSASLKRMRDSA